MSRALVIHPSPLVRASHRTLLQACGWQVAEASGRTDALIQLASAGGQRLGDLVLVDLSNWSVPGTALIRALRRQVACALPVAVVQAAQTDAALADQTARRAGANLILPHNSPPQALAAMLGQLSQQPLPGAARLGPDAVTMDASWGSDAWQQQCALLAQADAAAATVVSARQVFELLLSRRTDAGAAPAALSLTALAGGPGPLQRWAGTHHPVAALATVAAPLDALLQTDADRQTNPPVTLALLVIEAAGLCYGLRLDGPTPPTCWWTDDAVMAPPTAEAMTVSLNRLWGPSAFRRRMATERATVTFGPAATAGAAPRVLRVDEVLGLQHLAVHTHPEWLARASGCTGHATTGDGRCVLVLDAAAPFKPLTTVDLRSATAPR